MTDPTPPIPYATPVPLSVDPPDVGRQLATADLAWRPVRRAVRYAAFDGWTLAGCAILSVPCLSGGWDGVVVALILGGIAAVELVGGRRLRRVDPAAVRLLTINQFALAGVVLAYAGWNLYLTRSDRGMMGLLLSQGVAQAGPEAVELARQVVSTLYISLAVVGPAAAGSAAWFYASRSKHLARYLAETPAWVLAVHRQRGRL